MNTQEILSIVALSLLGLCLLCGLAKMAMKKDGAKKNCDKACSMAVFAAVVLLAISQLIGETDGYTPYNCTTNEDGTCEDVVNCGGACKGTVGDGCCVVGKDICHPDQLPCCRDGKEGGCCDNPNCG